MFNTPLSNYTIVCFRNNTYMNYTPMEEHTTPDGVILNRSNAYEFYKVDEKGEWFDVFVGAYSVFIEWGIKSWVFK
jgi:hypothetical protein